jgi:hypothetical protein
MTPAFFVLYFNNSHLEYAVVIKTTRFEVKQMLIIVL